MRPADKPPLSDAVKRPKAACTREDFSQKIEEMNERLDRLYDRGYLGTARMALLGREGIVRLWKEHGAALVLYARQLCDAPEDVVQEAFLQLAEGPRDLENPTGWIYRVVRNRALDVSRVRGRRVRREARSADHEPWFEESPVDGIEAAEATAALEALAADQREVIVARVWGGLSFEEIGALRGVSDTTAFRCYQRGLGVLRERLGIVCETKTTSPKS